MTPDGVTRADAVGRVITDPAEMDALPGRAIVVGHRGKWGTAWQLTSWTEGGPNWGSAWGPDDRLKSSQVLEREGSVTVLYVPEEDGR